MKKTNLIFLLLIIINFLNAQNQTNIDHAFLLNKVYSYIQQIDTFKDVNLYIGNKRTFIVKGKLSDNLNFEKEVKQFKSGIKREIINIVNNQMNETCCNIIMYNGKVFTSYLFVETIDKKYIKYKLTENYSSIDEIRKLK